MNNPTLETFSSLRMPRADIEVPNVLVDAISRRTSACYPQSNFYPLSDSSSTQNCRITKTSFRSCSTCWSCSQTFNILLRSSFNFRLNWKDLCTPPLPFGRKIPHLNYPSKTVKLPARRKAIRILAALEWSLTFGSTLPEDKASLPSHLDCAKATQIQF